VQVIPVLDIKNRLVVRGMAGERHKYQPIQSKLVESSKPQDVARAMVSLLGVSTAYVADLDAIEKGKLNPRIYEQLSKAGLRLWLDAGVGDVERADLVLECCGALAPDIVVGLESLESPAALRELVRIIGREACLFSLDLKHGLPLTIIEAWRSFTPRQIAEEALEAGVRRFIVLDLADVGVGGGTSTLDFCRTLFDDHGEHFAGGIELVAGGGVRNFEDLEHLADAGCSAALVASALHDGRLVKEDIERAREL
jgi:phosphoribosylformimino-5-aminoimidazole carboxamide ribotide isomerase